MKVPSASFWSASINSNSLQLEKCTCCCEGKKLFAKLPEADCRAFRFKIRRVSLQYKGKKTPV